MGCGGGHLKKLCSDTARIRLTKIKTDEMRKGKSQRIIAKKPLCRKNSHFYSCKVNNDTLMLTDDRRAFVPIHSCRDRAL
jgi:hypothetical protein